MVLEGSTSEDGFGNDASSPPSDNDIYNSQTETISYESLTETLPRSPFGSEAELQRVILARLKEHEQIVKRPLTKPEVEFSSYHSAKFYAIASYGRPVGTCYGLWRSYATRSTYKFPFLKPNFIKNPEIFPHERFAWLKGNAARGAWHGLRTTMHVWLGLSVAQLLFGVYGASVVSAAVAKDPRSKVFLDALRKNRDESRATNSMPAAQAESDQSPTADGYQDASPINEMQEAYQPNEVREVSPSYKIQEESRTSRNQEESPSSGNEESFSTNEPQESSTGSAWDRVRQQSPSGKKPSFENSVPRERSNTSFTPKKDDNIQSARDKAQREFDERVEQERRGEAFDAGKGGSDRW